MQAFAYYPSFIYREERPQWVEETLKHTQKYYDKTKEWLPEDAVVKQTQPMVEDKELQYLSSYFIDKSVSILKDLMFLNFFLLSGYKEPISFFLNAPSKASIIACSTTSPSE